MRLLQSLISIVCALCCGGSLAVANDQASNFRERVEPLLRKHCFECHSHQADSMEGGLALDWRSGWEVGGNRGPAIIAGDPEHSLLVQAIQYSHAELKMPDQKLAEADIAILVDWVQQGAFDDRIGQPQNTETFGTDWWSLRPVVRPEVPMGTATHPIDAFVQAKLQPTGIASSPACDKKTLLRRVYYDLIGLPPTIEQVQAFSADQRPDAYERLVDGLLASPQYGERWARHWLDTIHFADSHGYEHDIGRDNAWRFRDYVIESLNNDLPWPEFIRQQLAADFFYPEQTSLIPALGFLGAGTFDLSAYSTAPIAFEVLDRDDLVTQTMTAFASITANCARCHAHKFDPISQEDYYALQAVFAGIVKGDVAFDDDPSVANKRRSLQGLLEAAGHRDDEVLLASEHRSIVNRWLEAYGDGADWQTLEPEAFVSTAGATLARSGDGVIHASGLLPDQDTYVITARSTLATVTAIRLDILPDDALPLRGPGRRENGNFHLSEIELSLFEPHATAAQQIELRNASADFNQDSWGSEKAIDGNIKTAWGIHPQVGQAHHAVFELAQPQAIKPDTIIVVSLRQLHGDSHVLGAFRLSITGDAAIKSAALPAEVSAALHPPNRQRTQDEQITLAAYAIRRDTEVALGELPPQVRVYAAAPSVQIPTTEGAVQEASIAEPKPVYLLQRGAFDQPRQIVPPGALQALQHLPARFALTNEGNTAERRAALADWLAHRDNPLTYRSIVNRVWYYHFGSGICDTPSDMGQMGGTPSHLQLLDWLSVWFRDDARGSLKSLHWLIVTSDTYRQSSHVRDEVAAMDADNRWLWRQNRRRLDAEAVRDYLLAISGGLDGSMGGPGIQHFKKSKGPQSTPALDYADFNWNAPGAGRRSIYRYVWRGIADPFMESLDFPDLGLLAPTRGFSVSPLQSLALFNNDFVLYCSESLAQRVQREEKSAGTDAEVFLCVQSVWLREPTVEELGEYREFVGEHGLAAFCRLLFNSNEFLFVD